MQKRVPASRICCWSRGWIREHKSGPQKTGTPYSGGARRGACSPYSCIYWNNSWRMPPDAHASQPIRIPGGQHQRLMASDCAFSQATFPLMPGDPKLFQGTEYLIQILQLSNYLDSEIQERCASMIIPIFIPEIDLFIYVFLAIMPNKKSGT